MIRPPPITTQYVSSAASDVYKRQEGQIADRMRDDGERKRRKEGQIADRMRDDGERKRRKEGWREQ